MNMQQDITMPFMTVTVHKISNSYVAFFGGFLWGVSLTWSVLCSFEMLCLLVTETVCVFSYTECFLSCCHICSGTPFNSTSSCYFPSP